MKHFLLITFFSAFATTIVAQIPNNSFENWGNVSKDIYETVYNPLGWWTNNSDTTLGGVTVVSPAAAGYSGSNAIKIETLTWDFGAGLDTLNGGAVTGAYNGLNLPISGYPSTLRPIELTGYYKYSRGPGSVIDSAVIAIQLYKYNTVTNQRDTVGEGYIFLSDQASYTLFTVPVSYYSSVTPDSIEIGLSSSITDNIKGIPGSVLYVDDLAFTTSTGVVALSGQTETKLWPNPAAESINISNLSGNNVFVEIVNSAGNSMLRTRTTENTIQINTEDFATGLYIVQVYNDERALVYRGKITVMK